jgi:hypothetical protein
MLRSMLFPLNIKIYNPKDWFFTFMGMQGVWKVGEMYIDISGLTDMTHLLSIIEAMGKALEQ